MKGIFRYSIELAGKPASHAADLTSKREALPLLVWRSVLFFHINNIKNTVLEREYGGGSTFEFRAKMTVVKKQPIRFVLS